MSDPRGPRAPGEPVRIEEVERRLRSSFAHRAEDLAPGDGADDPELDLALGAPDRAPVLALADGSRHRPPVRKRVALVAAVAAVVLPLVVAAVALAGGDDPDPTRLPPAVPRPTACADGAAGNPGCDGTPTTDTTGGQRGRPTTTVTAPAPETATTEPSAPQVAPGATSTSTVPAPPSPETTPTNPPGLPTTTAGPPPRLSRSGG